MRKKSLALLITIMSVLVLAAACSTYVSVTTVAPATSGISGYKTIAVRETAPYSGRVSGYSTYINVMIDPFYYSIPSELYFMNSMADSRLADSVARNASGIVYNAVNQGYYTVYDSRATEGLISSARIGGATVRDTLLRNGVELLLTTKIESMDYNEYITIDAVWENGVVKGYNFYLNQSASVSMSAMVQDVNTLAILWTKTFSDKTRNYPTRIGYQEANGVFKWIDRYGYGFKNPEAMFNSMVNGFKSEITTALTPHQISTSFVLMETKKMPDNLKKGLEYADKGDYGTALAVFLAEWEANRSVVGGYNAAVLYFATRNYDKALEMANEVWNVTKDPEAYDLLARMKSILAQQEAAYNQIYGEKPEITVVQDLII